VAARVLRAGYLRIGRIRGAAVRVHWTLPVATVLLTFTSLRLVPGAWLGFLLVVLVHQIGHVVAVLRGGLRPVAIDVTGVGGVCRFEGIPTPRRRVLIAWSGVLAQAVLLLAAVVSRAVGGRPEHAFVADLVGALVRANGTLILFNLIPFRPFDGVEAWGVIPLVAAARARRRMDAEAARARPLPPPATAVVEQPEDLAPMPEEVRRVLDRIRAEGRAQYEAERKK
jgi:stage IV sporulation protein FB